MVTNRQILARWKKLAGANSPQPWTDEDDLVGFFEHFRPQGKGLEAVFEGVEAGDEVLPRLKQVFKATAKSSPDAPYFLPTPSQSPTASTVTKLLRQHWKKLSQIAAAVDDEEAVKLLSKMPPIKIVKGELPEQDEDPLAERIRDLVIDFQSSLRARKSSAHLLGEALYSMADSYAIPDYVLWPLYADSSDIDEPFAPAFQLWKQGVEWACCKGRIVAAVAKPIDERPRRRAKKAPPKSAPKTAPKTVAARGVPFPVAKARDWLRNLEDYNDDGFYLPKIEKGLSEKHLDLLYIAKFLAGLGRPISTRGLVQILENDASGWSAVYQAWKYLSWQYRAETAQVDAGMTSKGKLPKGCFGVHLDKAALCLLGAIALRQDEFADWCGQRLMRDFTRDDLLVHERNWDGTPFEPFAVRLYAKWRGREGELLEQATNDLVGAFPRQDKAYHPLLVGWDDAARFTPAWTALCDGFCKAIGAKFLPLPFCIFPAVHLAIARIRSDLGHADPRVAHVLFQAPIAQVPAKLPIAKKDPLFERVVLTCSKAFPKYALSWEW